MRGAKISEGGLVVASWSQIAKFISRSDVVLFVLDARDPCSTFSWKLVKLARKICRELIIVLNKCDLVPKEAVEEWEEFFESRGYTVVSLSATKRLGTSKLKETIREVAPSLPTVVIVVGYPKVGKSSVINALKRRHSASTSPYPGSPGYTKCFQLYRVDNDILLVDSPGILPVEGSQLERVLRGVPPERIPDPVGPAIMLIQRTLKYNPSAFRVVYGIELTDPLKILESLASCRGWFYKRTREPNIEEAARAIIRDYHNGKIAFYIRPSEIDCIVGAYISDKGQGIGGKLDCRA